MYINILLMIYITYDEKVFVANLFSNCTLLVQVKTSLKAQECSHLRWGMKDSYLIVFAHQGQSHYSPMEFERVHAFGGNVSKVDPVFSLSRFIRKNFGDYFCVSVAGYPEGPKSSTQGQKMISLGSDQRWSWALSSENETKLSHPSYTWCAMCGTRAQDTLTTSKRSLVASIAWLPRRSVVPAWHPTLRARPWSQLLGQKSQKKHKKHIEIIETHSVLGIHIIHLFDMFDHIVWPVWPGGQIDSDKFRFAFPLIPLMPFISKIQTPFWENSANRDLSKLQCLFLEPNVCLDFLAKWGCKLDVMSEG